jgi:hypothetical protein
MCDSDMYFYIFVMSDDRTGANMNSEQPATVEAIKHRGGKPLLDSQPLVDVRQFHLRAAAAPTKARVPALGSR